MTRFLLAAAAALLASEADARAISLTTAGRAPRLSFSTVRFSPGPRLASASNVARVRAPAALPWSSRAAPAPVAVSLFSADARPVATGLGEPVRLGKLEAGSRPRPLAALSAAARDGGRFWDRRSRRAGAPADFGAENGTEVSNKDAVPGLINAALGREKPPAFSYVLVQPFSMVKLWLLPWRWGTGTNPYSHALSFYTKPDGRQTAVNIVGQKGRDLVNHVPPAEYLYSTREFRRSSEQGGLYNRGMDELRVEKWPARKILAVEAYYRDLDRLAREGKARFSLMWGPVLNFFAWIRGSDVRWGNCGYWSGGALAAGDFAPQSMWPKLNWVRAYERLKALDPDNVHVVHYEKIWHAVTTFGVDALVPAFVAPLRWIRSLRYWRLKDYADVIVDTPPPGVEARVRRVTPRRR